MALGAYLLVRNDRFSSFEERATSTTRFATSIIDSALTNNGDVDVRRLVERLQTQGSFETLIVLDDEIVSSSATFDVEDVAPIASVDPDEDGYARANVQIDGRRGLLIRPAEDPLGIDLYLFFSSENLRSQLADLGSILWRAWTAVAIIAGALGLVLARRTLRPVARAGEAARSLAEGLLETRLPVEREDEFGAWAVSFNEMADELQKKIEALTEARDREIRFTSDVAHELRTPLTALVGSAELLRPHLDELDPDARWAAEHLFSEVIRLRSLVEELLEISRLDAGQETVSFAQVRTDAFLKNLIQRRGWDTQVLIKGDPCELQTDPRRLERIVVNLVENGLIHGHAPVTIETTMRDTSVHMSVVDEGRGIAEEDLEKIFQPFYKVDPARSGGTGLGLAIARQNAVLLGGSLGVSSDASSGTKFELRLPGQ